MTGCRATAARPSAGGRGNTPRPALVAFLAALLGACVSGAGLVPEPQPGWDVPPEKARVWTAIVLHHSASATGNAEVFHRQHQARGWEGLGYHFVITNGRGGPDGEVEVGWRWTAQREGAHAGDDHYNRTGVGICLVGNFETGEPTDKQYESLLQLVRWLARKHSIGPEGLKGHNEVRSRGPTACPGRRFPLERLKRDLALTAGAVVAAQAP